MRKIYTLLLILCHLLLAQAQPQALGLIPLPQKVIQGSGHYDLLSAPRITVSADLDEAALTSVRRVAQELSTATGTAFTVSVGTGGGIRIGLSATLSAESYTLNVTANNGVSIIAGDAAGVFYALQTLKQLLPRAAMAAVYDEQAQWLVPVVSIEDRPRFAWRGFMLDEGRHFFGKEEVKRVLDMMATYKLNRFHWHLTEDQGWRIEIKKYPKLTTIGSVRKWTNQWQQGVQGQPDYTPYGPFFYTQEDIREIVAYAKERHIEIIPEIDMPGHFVAALVSYPEYSCTPSASREVWTGWGISSDVLNVADPKAVQFVKDILDELIELFPFKYIHIGGDEAPTYAWQNNAACQALLRSLGSTNYHDLQTHFYRQINAHLANKADTAKRRQIVAWNETLSGSTDSLDVTIMSWTNADAQAKVAAQRGLDVILTPQIPYYINRRQSTLPTEPPTQGYGHETVKRVYDYVPASGVSADLLGHYKGVQANFWTEHVNSGSLLQYLMLPRLAAVAEAGWTNQDLRRYDNFVSRIRQDTVLFRLRGWNYGKHIMQDETPALPQASNGTEYVWHRLISVSTDAMRQGKCIELLHSGSPVLSQYSGSRQGQLWSATVAGTTDATYDYQWWAFVENPELKGRYALVCKALPDGSLNTQASASAHTGRWSYDATTRHYDFILGEAFENGTSPAISIRSDKHTGWYMNVAAAGQQYSINLWNNPHETKAGLWQCVPLLHQEKKNLETIIARAERLLAQPTYELADTAQIASYDKTAQWPLTQAVEQAKSALLTAQTATDIEDASQALTQVVRTFQATMAVFDNEGEYRLHSAKYPSLCLGTDAEGNVGLYAEGGDNTLWRCVVDATVYGDTLRQRLRLVNKEKGWNLNTSYQPARINRTNTRTIVSWDYDRLTWTLAANDTATRFAFPMPPTAWENAGRIFLHASPLMGTGWVVKKVNRLLSVGMAKRRTAEPACFIVKDGQICPLDGAALTVTSMTGQQWPVHRRLSAGVYLVSNGVQTYKIVITQ